MFSSSAYAMRCYARYVCREQIVNNCKAMYISMRECWTNVKSLYIFFLSFCELNTFFCSIAIFLLLFMLQIFKYVFVWATFIQIAKYLVFANSITFRVMVCFSSKKQRTSLLIWIRFISFILRTLKSLNHRHAHIRQTVESQNVTLN